MGFHVQSFRQLRRILALGVAATALASCAVLSGLPDPTTVEQRLAMMPATAPVQGPVTIHWNAQQVPFIEAQTDRDAAFALGMVHAHLRLGQMEVLRRLSQARLQEMAGPVPQVAQIEQALRILNLGKTSKQVYAAMQPEKKAWLDAFVAGVNYYMTTAEELPHEYTLLGLDRETWKPEEILTIGRLASIDVNWLAWFRLMTYRDRPDWPQLWAMVLEEGTSSAPSFDPSKSAALDGLTKMLSTVSRNGSNSFAVSKEKTGTGAAMIANDPHLGVNLPNLWLLAGVKSPSYNIVGFMVPGVPFVAVGRNENIAWGGTNMRSANSDLIDVSAVPADQIQTRTEPVSVRWWFDSEVTVRESPYGPILSDAEVLPKKEGETFALKWIGHYPSDELSAMLSVNRARNWDEFKSSLEGFSISPQNFLYADVLGNIGQVTATHLPSRSLDMPKDVVRPLTDAKAWDTIRTSATLPKSFNPPEGFLASSNNRGAPADIPIGYFFSADDRVLRLQSLLSEMPRVTAEDLKKMQMDAYSMSSVAMRDAVVARGKTWANLTPAQKSALDAMAAWNGQYAIDSKGAVAFEAAMATFMPAAFDQDTLLLLDSAGTPFTRLSKQVASLDAKKFQDALTKGLDSAAAAMALYPTWGDMHRMSIQAQYAAIPVIGSRYVFDNVASAGSGETVLKSDHGPTAEKHNTRYGAQARHVSDLSDPDANWFVMLGGNDGWFNSANFRDQVPAFMSGGSYKVPLRIETVRATFPHKMELKPATPGS
jgi:penicillin G amidase